MLECAGCGKLIERGTAHAVVGPVAEQWGVWYYCHECYEALELEAPCTSSLL